MTIIKYSAIISDRPHPLADQDPHDLMSLGISYQFGSIAPSIVGGDSNKHWKEWLGSLLWDQLMSKKKMILIATAATLLPDVMDQENERLNIRVSNVFRVLPLCGVMSPANQDAVLITGGGTLDGGVLQLNSIKAVGRLRVSLRSFFLTDETYLAVLRSGSRSLTTSLEGWALIARKCNELIFTSDARPQFLEAYRSFESAFFDVKFLEFKMPNLVRAIECLIGLKPGQGASEFAKRTAILSGQPDPTEPFNLASNYQYYLTKLYQLRNDCVHGKPFAWSLKNELGDAFTNQTVAAYEYALEWAARHALLNGFENERLKAAASDRDQLEQFWQDESRASGSS